MSVFCPILSFIAPYHMRKWRPIMMFLRRSLASLARAYKLHVTIWFFSRYIWGLAPPPPIPKRWLRYCCQLSLSRRVAKWRWPPIPSPPTRYTKSPPLVTAILAIVRTELRARGSEQFLWFLKNDLLQFHLILFIFDSSKSNFLCTWKGVF